MSSYERLLTTGIALLQLGGNEAAALQRFEAAMAQAPARRCEAWVNAAVVADSLGRTDEALRYLREALHRDPGHQTARENLAWLVGRADPQAGLAGWDAVIARWPDRATAWANKGALHERLGDRFGARDAYEQALALDPNLHAVAEALERLSGPDGPTSPPQE